MVIIVISPYWASAWLCKNGINSEESLPGSPHPQTAGADRGHIPTLGSLPLKAIKPPTHILFQPGPVTTGEGFAFIQPMATSLQPGLVLWPPGLLAQQGLLTP